MARAPRHRPWHPTRVSVSTEMAIKVRRTPRRWYLLRHHYPRCNSGCRGSRHIKWTWHAPGEQARARRATLRRVTMTAGGRGGVGIAGHHPLRLRLQLLVSSGSHRHRHRYRYRLCSLSSVRGAHAYRVRLRFRALICASCSRSVRARSLLCATPSAFLFGLGVSGEMWSLSYVGF